MLPSPPPSPKHHILFEWPLYKRITIFFLRLGNIRFTLNLVIFSISLALSLSLFLSLPSPSRVIIQFLIPLEDCQQEDSSEGSQDEENRN
jgi:hypothetical protein